MGFGEDDRRWTIDYEIIDGGIETERARAALDAYIKRRWPDQFGNYRGLDLVAADGNTWTPEIVAWARPHPGRVMVIRTAQSDSALPLAAPRGSEIRGKDGKPVKRTRYFLVGASQIKSVLYKSLAITDPNARAYIAFPRGLDDEFFRQLTAEKRKPEKRKDGFIKWSWVKTYERNEVLDTAVYAEAAAIRRGWRRFNSAQWAQLRTFLEHPNTNSAQPTLFDPDIAQIAGQAVAPAAITPPPEAVTQAQMPVPQPAHRAQSRRRFYQGNA
jgi:phage terminase large subunit GpA-like protein